MLSVFTLCNRPPEPFHPPTLKISAHRTTPCFLLPTSPRQPAPRSVSELTAWDTLYQWGLTVNAFLWLASWSIMSSRFAPVVACDSPLSFRAPAAALMFHVSQLRFRNCLRRRCTKSGCSEKLQLELHQLNSNMFPPGGKWEVVNWFINFKASRSTCVYILQFKSLYSSF